MTLRLRSIDGVGDEALGPQCANADRVEAVGAEVRLRGARQNAAFQHARDNPSHRDVPRVVVNGLR